MGRRYSARTNCTISLLTADSIAVLSSGHVSTTNQTWALLELRMFEASVSLRYLLHSDTNIIIASSAAAKSA